MTWARAVLIVGAGLALTLLVTAYYLRVSPLKHLDSVFLYESSLSVLESGQPTSATLPSYMREAITAFTLPAEELCAADLTTQDPRAYNILESHAYLAIYPIALLTSLAGPEAAFAILNALAHVALVVIPMFVMWRSSGVLAAVVMGLWVVVYPVWSYSATGDYYLDRLSMPFALLSLFLMDAMTRRADRLRDPRWLVAWMAATVAAAIFTERAALMMIGLIGFFLVFFPVLRQTWKAAGTLVATAAGLVMYLGWYFTMVRVPVPGAGDLFESMSQALQGDFVSLLQRPGMSTFLAVNLVLAGPLVLAAGARYVVLVLGAMLPNVLVVIGGAELNGFSTHYHVMYLPFVVFAVAKGIERLAQAVRGRAPRAAVLVGVGAYALVLTGALNPFSGRFDDQTGNPLGPGLAARMWSNFLDPNDSYVYLAGLAEDLGSVVPNGVRVSTVEAAMPTLYRDRSLSLYPMDFDRADYIVVPGTASDGRIETLAGAVSYLGQDVASQIDACLRERAVDRGYEIVTDDGGWLVLRRPVESG